MKTDLATVLRLVNLAREATGLPAVSELPKGEPKSYEACPLARALELATVDPGLAMYREGYAREAHAIAVAAAWGTCVSSAWHGGVYLPEPLREFVREFDAGKIEELEEK